MFATALATNGARSSVPVLIAANSAAQCAVAPRGRESCRPATEHAPTPCACPWAPANVCAAPAGLAPPPARSTSWVHSPRGASPRQPLGVGSRGSATLRRLRMQLRRTWPRASRLLCPWRALCVRAAPNATHTHTHATEVLTVCRCRRGHPACLLSDLRRDQVRAILAVCEVLEWPACEPAVRLELPLHRPRRPPAM